MDEFEKILRETPIYTDTSIKPDYFKTEEARLREKIYILEREVESLREKQVRLPERYIINSNATVLFWKNGEKTVVKRCADDDFKPRLAFLTAFFQRYCRNE